MNIRLYCRKERTDKSGVAEIIFMVGANKIGTKEYCSPRAWDQQGQKVSNKFNGSAQVNNQIRKKYEILDQILKSQSTFEIKQVRRLFKKYLVNPDKFSIDSTTVENTDNFSVIIEGIIDSHRNQWSEGHRKKFRTIRTKILNFDPDFNVGKISRDWWQDYVDHCFDELENSHNTIQTDFKAIWQLSELLLKKGYKINDDFFTVSMSYIEPKIEPLYWDEVKAIADLDLTEGYRKRFEDSRYLWVLGAYVGQRWKDMQRVGKHSFFQKKVDGELIWYYSNRIQKTKKLIEVMLLEEAVQWLKKRDFEIPKLAQQVVNRDIKEIAKIAEMNEPVSVLKVIKGQIVETFEPRWKRIHIHTGRHSFAVELVKKSVGLPYAERFVSEMLGHASPATTWKYFNFVSPQKDKMFLQIMRKDG